MPLADSPLIAFTARPGRAERFGRSLVVRLPADASERLPSRGIVMAEIAIAGERFHAVIEPDGERGHWFAIPARVPAPSAAVTVEITPTDRWIEPKIPLDLRTALDADPIALSTWKSLTPSARWDWIRWISSCKGHETRAKRIGSVASRMAAGKRRPCCFDRCVATLTEPEA